MLDRVFLLPLHSSSIKERKTLPWKHPPRQPGGNGEQSVHCGTKKSSVRTGSWPTWRLK